MFKLIGFFFTALASEERGNVIARVCMSVCPYVRPYVRMCVTKMCNEYKFAPSMQDDGFLSRSVTSSCRLLYVTTVRDDSNLLYSDISRGDELKPN
jgi:hypothetical protein